MNIFHCRVDLKVDRPLRRTMLNRAALPPFLSSSKGPLDPPCARTLAQLASGGTILATELFGRGGRAVECAGLENRKAERPREFESHPLRSEPDWPFRLAGRDSAGLKSRDCGI